MEKKADYNLENSLNSLKQTSSTINFLKDKNPNILDKKNFKYTKPNFENNNSIDTLNNFSETIKSFLKNNKRSSYKDINEFCQLFRLNMNALINLSNLFEQTTIIKVQNLASELINIIGMSLDPIKKKDILESKLRALENVVRTEFSSVIYKVNEYQSVSENKISRIEENVKNKLTNILNISDSANAKQDDIVKNDSSPKQKDVKKDNKDEDERKSSVSFKKY